MLVVSRKLGEKVYIGDNIFVQVVQIDQGKIRLGISAPSNVAIWREEILKKMQEEKQDGRLQDRPQQDAPVHSSCNG